MSKDPAFLFYPQDFLIGTAEMSNEEVGQYIRILSYMHQKGRMNEKTISFLVGSVSDNVRLKFGIDSDNRWYNDRLEKEMEKRANFTKSRRENGKKGGRPRKLQKPLGKPTDNHMGNVNENEILINKLKSDSEIFNDCQMKTQLSGKNLEIMLQDWELYYRKRFEDWEERLVWQLRSSFIEYANHNKTKLNGSTGNRDWK